MRSFEIATYRDVVLASGRFALGVVGVGIVAARPEDLLALVVAFCLSQRIVG